MTALVWRKEPPKAPGWYWWRWKGRDRGQPVYVKQKGRCLLACLYTSGAVGVSTVKGLGEWGGQIPEPEEEKK